MGTLKSSNTAIQHNNYRPYAKIQPINYNCDENHSNTLRMHQNKYIKNNDTLKEVFIISVGSTVAIQSKDRP